MCKEFNAYSARLREYFDASDIEWRIDMARAKNDTIIGTCVPYVKREAIVARFDAVLGAFNWYNEFFDSYANSLGCRIWVRCPVCQEWLSKEDGAGLIMRGNPERTPEAESNAVKSVRTDALKRTATHWGVAGYLAELEGPHFIKVAERGLYGQVKLPNGEKRKFYWQPPPIPALFLPSPESLARDLYDAPDAIALQTTFQALKAKFNKWDNASREAALKTLAEHRDLAQARFGTAGADELKESIKANLARYQTGDAAELRELEAATESLIGALPIAERTQYSNRSQAAARARREQIFADGLTELALTAGIDEMNALVQKIKPLADMIGRLEDLQTAEATAVARLARPKRTRKPKQKVDPGAPGAPPGAPGIDTAAAERIDDDTFTKISNNLAAANFKEGDRQGYEVVRWYDDSLPENLSDLRKDQLDPLRVAFGKAQATKKASLQSEGHEQLYTETA